MSRLGAPVETKQRHIILDALRGFALMGICLANFQEFSLYSFLDNSARNLFSSAALNEVVQWILYILIDGKFYTIFSLLFGIGFSIILENNRKRGANGPAVFYRRMIFLFMIGLCHLLFLWSGDILMLYALVGLLLPLFRNLKNKVILIIAAVCLFVPVLIDYVCQFTGVYLSSKLVEWQWLLCDRFGITEENFAYWLRDAHDYTDMWKFLLMGAVERMQEFVDGNRYFKVLGLFLIGYYIGKNQLYLKLDELKPVIKRICLYGLCFGLPLSGVYAWSAMSGKPLGFGTHSLFYFVSVYLTSFGFVAAFCMLYLKNESSYCWKTLSMPGRMALTNYIGQSVLGIFVFYGIGMGTGADTPLYLAELIALAVFCFEMIFSGLWLQIFRFGPLEWIWRCLTYLKFFNPLNRNN